MIDIDDYSYDLIVMKPDNKSFHIYISVKKELISYMSFYNTAQFQNLQWHENEH